MEKEKYVYVVQDKSKLLLLNHVTSGSLKVTARNFHVIIVCVFIAFHGIKLFMPVAWPNKDKVIMKILRFSTSFHRYGRLRSTAKWTRRSPFYRNSTSTKSEKLYILLFYFN